MAGAISIPLPAFQQSFPDPFKGDLTTDGESVVGNLTISPGVKINGVEGSQTTIGGFSASAEVKDGKASFSGKVDILKQSYTFNSGEELSLEASVTVNDMRYTIVLTGNDIKPKAIIFDKQDYGKLSGGKSVKGSVTLMEDPLFKEAGIFIPGFGKFKRWVQKLTISLQATLEDEDGSKGSTRKTATLTRTLEWSLRPLFGPSSDEPPKPPLPPFIPPEQPIDKIPIIIALPPILYLFMSGYQSTILPLFSKQYLQIAVGKISSQISEIQNKAFTVANEAAKSEATVEELSSESAKLTEEIEAAEAEIETAEAGMEATEAGIETAEGVLAAAETAETAAAAEVAAAIAAEAAASASEAADFWTIIGGIISAGAIAAAAAAVAVAVKKHNEAVKKKKEAQAQVDEKKAKISQEQVNKKRGETTKMHKSDELKVTQDKLKIAQENQRDMQDVKDILKAAHVGLEKLQKEIKSKLEK